MCDAEKHVLTTTEVMHIVIRDTELSFKSILINEYWVLICLLIDIFGVGWLYCHRGNVRRKKSKGILAVNQNYPWD